MKKLLYSMSAYTIFWRYIRIG